MIKNSLYLFSALLLLMIGACATMPAGPSVMVMPPPGKPFEQFQADDAVCRQWAAQRTGLAPQETVNQNIAGGAVAGTAIGAGLGAAIGSTSGHAGAGAAIGAATGLLVGSSAGANEGQVYGWRAQRRYDIAYMQCMYSKGNEVPGMSNRSGRRASPPPPPDLSAPDNAEPRY